MSDAEEAKPQAAKPSRLSGLIAPKGAAPRPSEQSSPAAAPTPAVEPIASPIATAFKAATPPIQATPIGTGSKSLTLRLPDAEYERLRVRAFASRMTHQAILAEALRLYLDAVNVE